MKDETILLSIIGAIILIFAYQFYKIKCRPTPDKFIINSLLELMLALIIEINNPTNKVVKIFYQIFSNRTKMKALYDISKIVLNNQVAVDRISLIYRTLCVLIYEFRFVDSSEKEISMIITKHFNQTEQIIITSTLLDLLKMWIDFPIFTKVNRKTQENVVFLINTLDPQYSLITIIQDETAI